MEGKRKISGSVAPRRTLKALFFKKPRPLLPQPPTLSSEITGGNVGEDMLVVVRQQQHRGSSSSAQLVDGEDGRGQGTYLKESVCLAFGFGAHITLLIPTYVRILWSFTREEQSEKKKILQDHL